MNQSNTYKPRTTFLRRRRRHQEQDQHDQQDPQMNDPNPSDHQQANLYGNSHHNAAAHQRRPYTNRQHHNPNYQGHGHHGQGNGPMTQNDHRSYEQQYEYHQQHQAHTQNRMTELGNLAIECGLSDVDDEFLKAAFTRIAEHYQMEDA